MASPPPSEPPPPVPFAFTVPQRPPSSPPGDADRPVSHSSVCPHSCTDELVVGAFKGAFAGSLWGAYSFHRNLLAVRATAQPHSAAAAAGSHPLAALSTSARLKLLSPLLVYPVKFASLYSLYRFFSCATCYLAPSPPAPSSVLGPLLHSALSASLAGLATSLPYLSPRSSVAHAVGCGGLGAASCVALAGLGWLGEAVDSATRSARRAADRRREEG